MARDFPDVRDGDQIEPWWFNRFSAELRRWRKAQGAGGIVIDNTRSATVPPVVRYEAPDWGQLAVASGAISARSGANYGTGDATLQVDNGTGFTSTDVTVPVKNRLNKTVASGSGIILLRAQGSYWVVAVDDCTHLS